MQLLNTNRLDLSNWIIHFVHKRKPEDDPATWSDPIETPDGERMPDYIDEKGNSVYMLDEFIENEFSIPEDADAFMVLQKIVHDGFIHSGWAIRNYRPTIYGPSSAVCFTEMPLYALIDYARTRGPVSGYVGNYGIAFKRNELFAAGARPVIYGLSTEHKEADTDENGVYQGRILSVKDTGVGLKEQYRYVATNLTKGNNPNDKQINWTMEREWRWAVPHNPTGIPGLPFFLSKDYADFFTDIIIIVETNEQQSIICDQLRNQYDAGARNCGIDYNTKRIADAKVLSLESLSNISGVISKLRLEDIPFAKMKRIPNYTVPQSYKDKLSLCFTKLDGIHKDAINNYIKTHPEYNAEKDWFGFAYVYTYDFTPMTQALVEMGLASSYSEGKYIINKGYMTSTSYMTLLEVGAKAVADYLTSELGQEFYMESRPD